MMKMKLKILFDMLYEGSMKLYKSSISFTVGGCEKLWVIGLCKGKLTGVSIYVFARVKRESFL